VIFVTAVVAMFAFANLTQHFFIARNRIYESLLLILVVALLMRPYFFANFVGPFTVTEKSIQKIETTHMISPEGREQLEQMKGKTVWGKKTFLQNFVTYTLTWESLDNLEYLELVSSETVEQLRGLEDQQFADEAAFIEAMNTTVGQDLSEESRSAVVQSAEQLLGLGKMTVGGVNYDEFIVSGEYKLLRSALLDRSLFAPMRYVVYILGIALYGLIYLIQLPRARRREAALVAAS
jgi:hypothetical protein